jgi:hypothetical protein
MTVGAQKTFTFVSWDPEKESLPTFRDRVKQEFEEFVDELVEAAGEENGTDAETGTETGGSAEQKPV